MDITTFFLTRAAPQGPEQLVLPELRQLEEYLNAQCKGEISTLRQSRHVRQATEVFEMYDRIRQALMHGRAGQAGLDTAALTKDDVELVATMDRPSFMTMDDLNDSALFGVSTLQRFGLPFGLRRLRLRGRHSAPHLPLLPDDPLQS